MTQTNKQTKENLTAILIGFFLILIIVIIFIVKSFWIKNEATTVTQKKILAQEKKDNQYQGLTSDELLKRINNKENIVLLDLRTKASFQKEHLLNSNNLSVTNLTAESIRFNPSKYYVLIDNLGLTAKEIKVLGFLSQEGFKQVAYLEGGFSGWKENFNPTISYGDPYSMVDQSKVTYIKSDALNKLINQNNQSNLYIIDLRDNKKFQAGHLKMAINIPLNQLENNYQKVPLNKKIILCDDNGLLAFQGAVRLFDMGFFNVYALSDGLSAWKTKDFALVK